MLICHNLVGLVFIGSLKDFLAVEMKYKLDEEIWKRFQTDTFLFILLCKPSSFLLPGFLIPRCGFPEQSVHVCSQSKAARVVYWDWGVILLPTPFNDADNFQCQQPASSYQSQLVRVCSPAVARTFHFPSHERHGHKFDPQGGRWWWSDGCLSKAEAS